MFKHKRLRYITIFLLLVLSFTFAAPTFACLGNMPTLEESIDVSEIVFVGTVVEIISFDNRFMIARVEVETYLQGTGPAVVNIYPLQSDYDAICHYYPPLLGIRAMFFAHEHDNTRLRNYAELHGISYSDDPLLLVHSQSSSVIYPPDDDTITEARSYLNNPLRPFYRLQRQMERWTQHYHLRDMLPLLGLGFACVLGIGFVVKSRRYNSQKPKRG
jgi:hypothetical protein